MSKGCFIVYINPENEWDIKCGLLEDVEEDTVPEEQVTLFHSVEEASSYISTLKNTKSEIKKKYLNELLSLAQVGLVGKNPAPKLSLKTLEKLKDKICIQEGNRIKNTYMCDLGKYAIIIALILLIIKYIVFKINFSYLDKYIYVSIGSVIGTWISFGARKLNLSFEELSLIEEDGLNPWMRLIYICACSNIVLLFLSSELIEISLGKFNLNTVNKSIELQFLLGAICGLIEYKIGTGIFNKANDILKF
ncbi:hypothetical protein [Clostridioides sp. ZZV14-6387]|uniref:hypothetical protein n=1 Tax=Clostridioides sp. ZZV14-6387 TaxID=2811497 RepID=UPI001D12A91A|nr:hypothetical protein [Clostridioides sp. ZZV14-6387]HEH6783568.1 hypothetical protein [Clostridioides difficile]